MTKTILIPTDFSKNAYCALQYTTKLFAENKCKFIILHSFENQVTNLTSRIDIGKTEAVVTELYTSCEAKCEDVKHQITLDARNDKHSYSTIATSLSLSRAINKLIVKEHVDFVAMGGKGKTGASDILLGRNTLAMLQKIKKAPLLVIPEEYDFKPIRKIAFATGFKRAYSENEIQPLVFLSSLSDVNIKVIHAHKKEKMTAEQRANFHHLFELLKDSKPENNWLHGEADISAVITSYLAEKEIDLLAMIHYKHNAIVRFFREATVKDIAKYTRLPFLILPELD